jgi:hypothetical protein
VRLAKSFDLEMMQATAEGDFSKVARIGVDLLDFSSCVRRGGMVLDLLHAIWQAGMAIDNLRKVRADFDSPQRVFLLKELARIEIEQEPYAEILLREQRWNDEVGHQEEPVDTETETQSADVVHPILCPITKQELIECGLTEDEQAALLHQIQCFADMPSDERNSMQRDYDNHVIAMLRMLSSTLRSANFMRRIRNIRTT